MKPFYYLFLFLLCMGTVAQAQAPAFPGAEGHARYTTTGGRGGNVYHVTTLADDASGSTRGSLRWCLKQSGPRTIVFDVSGYIDLVADLTIQENTTIAGQTAPEPGITLRYYTVRPNGNNIIIRFIRCRRSQVKDVNDGADAIWTREYSNQILDHCSFSWSIDEVASFYDMNCFTMQWCTLGESLNNAGHSKDAHGYGGIWGGKLTSFHHNLITHVSNRSPRFNGARYMKDIYKSNPYYSTYNWENAVQAENVDMRNCLIYNCNSGCYGGPGGGYINIVNNYYKAGPARTSDKQVTKVTVGASNNSTSPALTGLTSRYYINGNYVTAAGSAAANYDWTGVTYDSGVFTINGQKYSVDPNHYYGSGVTYVKNSSDVDCVKIKLDAPCPTGDITTHSAQNAYTQVMAYGGASLYRDAVDERYMREVKNGTATYTGTVTGKGGLIDLINDPSGTQDAALPSFPALASNSRPAGYDTDADGMPDAWELANGLNPNNAADGKTYTIDAKGWYTNLEVYMNSIVEDIVKAQNANAISAVEEYYPALPSEGSMTLACNTKGSVSINGGEALTNVIEEVGVFASLENTITFEAAAGCRLEQVTLNGVDVTSSVSNNTLKVVIPKDSKMNVLFSGQNMDINGDGSVTIADVVMLVNYILDI